VVKYKVGASKKPTLEFGFIFLSENAVRFAENSGAGRDSPKRRGNEKWKIFWIG
jgi:hypothetical protein